MKDREEIVSAFKQCGLPGACLKCQYGAEREGCYAALRHDVLELLKEQPEIVRCKDCKHWDKTTREEGNDCILGQWEDAVCDVFRDWDSYGDLGEHFRRTNGDWFCADGERR